MSHSANATAMTLTNNEEFHGELYCHWTSSSLLDILLTKLALNLSLRDGSALVALAKPVTVQF
jgi:hypothetical protein